MTSSSISRRSLLLASGALVATGALGRVALAQDKSRLVWWMDNGQPDEIKALDDIVIQPYEQAHPNVDLQVDYRGSDISDQMMVALAANTGPDIVMTNGPSWTDQMVQSNKLAPLDEYSKKFGWQDKLPSFMLDLGKTDGVLYALPTTSETQVLFFNQTLFNKNGYSAPKTREEFEKIADDCLAKHIIPFAAGNSGARFVNRQYVSIVWNSYAGGEAIYEALTGKMPWNSTVFVEGIQMLKDWWDKGYFGGQNYYSMTQEQAFTFMATGRSAMCPMGTWALGWIPESFGKTGQELGWAPMPKLSDQVDYPVFGIGVGGHIAINAACKDKDDAADLLNMLTEPEVIGPLSVRWPGGWDVPLLATAKIEGSKYDQMGQDIRAATAAATKNNTYGYLPWSFWPPKTDDYMKATIEEVWLGQITPQDFCDGVNEVFQGELAAGTVKSLPPRG